MSTTEFYVINNLTLQVHKGALNMKLMFFIAMIIESAFLIFAGISFYIESTTSFFPKLITFILLLVDGVAYFVFVLLKHDARSYAIIFTGFIFANIALTFTDQMGLWDYLILVLNIFILLLYYAIYIKKIKFR